MRRKRRRFATAGAKVAQAAAPEETGLSLRIDHRERSCGGRLGLDKQKQTLAGVKPDATKAKARPLLSTWRTPQTDCLCRKG